MSTSAAGGAGRTGGGGTDGRAGGGFDARCEGEGGGFDARCEGGGGGFDARCEGGGGGFDARCEGGGGGTDGRPGRDAGGLGAPTDAGGSPSALGPGVRGRASGSGSLRDESGEVSSFESTVGSAAVSSGIAFGICSHPPSTSEVRGRPSL
ncbi:MAG: hypothetical protein HYZ29_01765 [Myxococcales bacterium]|nr:hypothetical protein [Myxococcales bacterium]